jgi:hypothetical protein
MMLPVDIIDGLDPTPSTWLDDDGQEHKFKKGGKIAQNAPIEVKFEFFNLFPCILKSELKIEKH